MSDTIYLETVLVSMRIGCDREERSCPQPVRFDIEIDYDAHAAGQSDKLADALDYVAAYRSVEEIAQSRVFKLLECVSDKIAVRLLDLGALKVRVKASKERTPIPGFAGHVSVEIRRSRDDR